MPRQKGLSLTEDEEKLSKQMSCLLRYDAVEKGIAVDEGGWSLMADVIKRMSEIYGRRGLSWPKYNEAVANAAEWSGFPQKRFALETRQSPETLIRKVYIKATRKVSFQRPQQNASASSSGYPGCRPQQNASASSSGYPGCRPQQNAYASEYPGKSDEDKPDKEPDWSPVEDVSRMYACPQCGHQWSVQGESGQAEPDEDESGQAEPDEDESGQAEPDEDDYKNGPLGLPPKLWKDKEGKTWDVFVPGSLTSSGRTVSLTMFEWNVKGIYEARFGGGRWYPAVIRGVYLVSQWNFAGPVWMAQVELLGRFTVSMSVMHIRRVDGEDAYTPRELGGFSPGPSSQDPPEDMEPLSSDSDEDEEPPRLVAMHPSELDTCRCDVVREVFWVIGEEAPRCVHCVRPWRGSDGPLPKCYSPWASQGFPDQPWEVEVCGCDPREEQHLFWNPGEECPRCLNCRMRFPFYCRKFVPPP